MSDKKLIPNMEKKANKKIKVKHIPWREIHYAREDLVLGEYYYLLELIEKHFSDKVDFEEYDWDGDDDLDEQK